jgi:hypothetical protein
VIRALLPFDAAAVLYFYSKGPVNQAKPRDRLGKGQRGRPSFFPLPLGRRRYSLGFFHRGLIHGLVSARSCLGLGAWEIDQLISSEGQHELCLNLLERLSQVLGRLSVERLFLSLPANSPLLDLATRAGFRRYLDESLFRFQGAKLAPSAPPDMLRPKSEDDEYQLFQLYNAVVPMSVRIAEGLSFQQWRQARERVSKGELVCEKDGHLCAWLRIRMDEGSGQLEILAQLDKPELSHLIQWSLALLDGQWPIFCLSADFQEQLQRLLTEQGFEQVAQYCRLVKQLTAPAQKLEFVPSQA